MAGERERRGTRFYVIIEHGCPHCQKITKHLQYNYLATQMSRRGRKGKIYLLNVDRDLQEAMALWMGISEHERLSYLAGARRGTLKTMSIVVAPEDRLPQVFFPTTEDEENMVFSLLDIGAEALGYVPPRVRRYERRRKRRAGREAVAGAEEAG